MDTLSIERLVYSRDVYSRITNKHSGNVSKIAQDLARLIREERIFPPYAVIAFLDRVPDKDETLRGRIAQQFCGVWPLLCTYVPLRAPKDGGIPSFPLDTYAKLDYIVDFFTEAARAESSRDEHRMQSAASAMRSSVFWTRHLKGTELAANDFARTLWCSRVMVPSMSATFSKWVCDTLRPMRVLDFCGGWGGRMLGGCASRSVVRWVSVDPNVRLARGLAHLSLLIRECASAERRKLDVLHVTGSWPKVAQSHEWQQRNRDKFDLVFTAPPPWNRERYAEIGAASQSNSGGCDLSKEKWVQQWLAPAIRAAADLVEVGGDMVFQVPPFLREDYTHTVLGMNFADGVTRWRAITNELVYITDAGPRDLLHFRRI